MRRLESLMCIAFFIPLIIAPFIIKEKKTREKLKDLLYEKQLTDALKKTGVHRPYKKPFRISYLINLGIILCIISMFASFIFLPVFQIKANIFGEESISNFSIYDNYNYLLQLIRENIKADDPGLQTLSFMVIAAECILIFLIITIIHLYLLLRTEKYTLKAYVRVKTNDLMDFEFILAALIIIATVCMVMTAQIYTIIFYKNSEIKSSYFSLCSGVSGYLAVPIILFALAVGFWIYNIYFRRGIAKKIREETVPIAAEQKSESGE